MGQQVTKIFGAPSLQGYSVKEIGFEEFQQAIDKQRKRDELDKLRQKAKALKA